MSSDDVRRTRRQRSKTTLLRYQPQKRNIQDHGAASFSGGIWPNGARLTLAAISQLVALVYWLPLRPVRRRQAGSLAKNAESVVNVSV